LVTGGREAAGAERRVSARQGAERELLLEEVNNYLRAIQYQQLEKAGQFGAAEPPGFYFEARAPPPWCQNETEPLWPMVMGRCQGHLSWKREAL